jgi:2-iminobutanoate/2-iminopropanoate deaminase
MTIERTQADGGMSFSKAVAMSGNGKWVFLSGQVGQGDDGQIVPGGVEPETMRAFELLLGALAEMGGATEHIVRTGAYLTDLTEYAAYGAVRESMFAGNLPSSTAVEVKGLLLGAHVEVDAVAFIPL